MAKVQRAFRPIWSRWRAGNCDTSTRRADLGDLTSPPGNRLEALAGDRKGNTRSGSTTNSECALFGRPKARQRSRSWTRGGRVKKETPFAWGTPIAAPRIERSAGLPNGRSLVASRQSDPGCDDRSCSRLNLRASGPCAVASSQSGHFRLGSRAPLVPIDAPLPWVRNEL